MDQPGSRCQAPPAAWNSGDPLLFQSAVRFGPW